MDSDPSSDCLIPILGDFILMSDLSTSPVLPSWTSSLSLHRIGSSNVFSPISSKVIRPPVSDTIASALGPSLLVGVWHLSSEHSHGVTGSSFTCEETNTVQSVTDVQLQLQLILSSSNDLSIIARNEFTSSTKLFSSLDSDPSNSNSSQLEAKYSKARCGTFSPGNLF